MSAPLKPSDVAAMFSLSVQTVRRLAERGELRGVRAGGQWRFSEAAVAEWQAAHTSAPAESEQAIHSRTARQLGVSASANIGALPDGPYEAVFAGPVAWRSEVIEPAARPAARRSGSAMRTKRAALSSN